MDGLRLYVLFKSLPVISERRGSDGGVGGGRGDGNLRLYAMEPHLQSDRFPSSHSISTCTCNKCAYI